MALAGAGATLEFDVGSEPMAGICRAGAAGEETSPAPVASAPGRWPVGGPGIDIRFLSLDAVAGFAAL